MPSHISAPRAVACDNLHPVSYTHLDVYKRQGSLVGRGDKVAIVEPDYFDNRKLVEFFEGEMVPIHMNWKDAAPHTSGIDLKELEEAFKNGVKLFLYSNPNNPTGAVFSKEEVSEIARLAKKYDVARCV